jgi:hypothetical protein
MERAATAWTDERLDDLSARMDAGFERVDRDIRDLGGRVDGLGGRIDGLGVRIDALQVTMLRVGGGTIVALIGVIGAILVRG